MAAWHEQIVTLYLSGLTIDETKKEVGCGRAAVRRVLKERNIPVLAPMRYGALAGMKHKIRAKELARIMQGRRDAEWLYGPLADQEVVPVDG